MNPRTHALVITAILGFALLCLYCYVTSPVESVPFRAPY